MGPTKKGGETPQTTGERRDRPTKKAGEEGVETPQPTRGRENTNQQGRGDGPTKKGKMGTTR